MVRALASRVEFVVGSCPCSEGFSHSTKQWMKSRFVKMLLQIPIINIIYLLLYAVNKQSIVVSFGEPCSDLVYMTG